MVGVGVRVGVGRAVLKSKERKRFVTPTEMKVHGDALCFMASWSWDLLHFKADVGWRWVAVGGGGWRWVAVGGGGWLAVGGSWGLSLRAVLNNKKDPGS